ncbi:MAG: helix-turn-helix transcriptional regulator [Oscillospiraceae bacterium]|nr:helix-turn-helix transcriptional regulator [Oscillospiraceae bacterium]
MNKFAYETKAFSNMIRKSRQASGYTLAEFAEKSDLSIDAVRDVEAGNKFGHRFSTLIKYLAALNIDFIDLMVELTSTVDKSEVPYTATKGLSEEYYFEAMVFGDMIRKYRKSSGLSVKEFAQIIGKHYTCVYKIEEGTKRPALSTILQLCGALNIDFIGTSNAVTHNRRQKGAA